MSSAWEKAKEIANQQTGMDGGLFVKLSNDKDKIVGVFCGEPYIRDVYWNGSGYDPYDKSIPAHAAQNPIPSIKINFYVPGEDAMKILERTGKGFIENIVKVMEKYGLDKKVFEIERHGTKGFKKTTYSIMPEQDITDEMRKRISELKLHELTQNTVSKPMDEDNVKLIRSRLQALPKEDVSAFLSNFGVQRVAEIKAHKTNAAHEYLDKIEMSKDNLPF